VWIPGYWNWVDTQYVWTDGEWATPPSAGEVWVPAQWVWVGTGWQWQEGYWAPPPPETPLPELMAPYPSVPTAPSRQMPASPQPSSTSQTW
jgi:hypothetical protein